MNVWVLSQCLCALHWDLSDRLDPTGLEKDKVPQDPCFLAEADWFGTGSMREQDACSILPWCQNPPPQVCADPRGPDLMWLEQWLRCSHFRWFETSSSPPLISQGADVLPSPPRAAACCLPVIDPSALLHPPPIPSSPRAAVPAGSAPPAHAGSAPCPPASVLAQLLSQH